MTTMDTQEIDLDALRAKLLEMARAAQTTDDVRGVTIAEGAIEREELRREVDHLDALLARQRAILTGVANALRGDPGPLASHSHHDLAERAAAVVAERDAAVADAARARAAYATDLAGLRAEVRRADDARAAWRDLRDAAREMLTALEAPAPVWDADESEHDAHAARLTRALDAVRAMLAGGGAAGDATMRRDLPAEAVVVCPACGVDITADLDDGAVYVTRRHSRREPARVGAGEIVWCDGGRVAP